MTFTDDDLKRLKEHIEQGKHYLDPLALKALLARLEAAEESVHHFWVVHEHGFKDFQNCKKSVDKWRKEAGK